ncbi:hypothetical protein C8Q74DRAFT_900845 [Fomes fomentarius]|nr:hypothetical protein C8Q74DRAFT_900845 [Fomes fomentarius]
MRALTLLLLTTAPSGVLFCPIPPEPVHDSSSSSSATFNVSRSSVLLQLAYSSLTYFVSAHAVIPCSRNRLKPCGCTAPFVVVFALPHKQTCYLLGPGLQILNLPSAAGLLLTHRRCCFASCVLARCRTSPICPSSDCCTAPSFNASARLCVHIAGNLPRYNLSIRTHLLHRTPSSLSVLLPASPLRSLLSEQLIQCFLLNPAA